MKKSIKITLGLILAALLAFGLASIFLLADLRTSDIKNNTQSKEQILFAKNLITQAIQKQGLDKINQFTTYEVIASDNWKGMMGEMGNPWGWNEDEMAMRFSMGDFDSQVEVLAGEKKGFVAGIQSWDYYEKKGGKYQSDVEDDNGFIFTVAAYHYFFELANRLSNAPFIRYAGKAKLKGKPMEKIFVSWGNECTHEYDHYLVWIGKESGVIEATAFSTRENPMPAPAFLYGSMVFDDFREVNGILIPFKQTAQLGDPKDNTNEFVHQLTIRKFEWDSFDVSTIRPLPGINPMGDDKSGK